MQKHDVFLVLMSHWENKQPPCKQTKNRTLLANVDQYVTSGKHQPRTNWRGTRILVGGLTEYLSTHFVYQTGFQTLRLSWHLLCPLCFRPSVGPWWPFTGGIKQLPDLLIHWNKNMLQLPTTPLIPYPVILYSRKGDLKFSSVFETPEVPRRPP